MITFEYVAFDTDFAAFISSDNMKMGATEDEDMITGSNEGYDGSRRKNRISNIKRK